MRAPALVLLNPAARHGRAGRLWERVRPEVERLFAPAVVPLDAAATYRDRVASALGAGTRVFIAAGGDGTVHALAEAIASGRGSVPLSGIALGAVGLGSSNDFLKPFGRRLAGVPVRLDVDGAARRDLGRVRWLDPEGRGHESVLVASASAGVVADGNALFSAGRLGRLVPSLAIAWATARALARNRGARLSLRPGGAAAPTYLAFLSVLKTPWLSGCLRFDVPVAPDDGSFAVAVCEATSRHRLLGVLAGLVRGRFAGRAGTRVFRTAALELEADAPFALELDGEVVAARRAAFDLFPEGLLACA